MDNIFFDKKCPAKMNNERNLRDYHTKSVLNEYYKSVLEATNEHDYRKKLQKQGTKIIEGNMSYLLNNAQCRCDGVPCKLN